MARAWCLVKSLYSGTAYKLACRSLVGMPVVWPPRRYSSPKVEPPCWSIVFAPPCSAAALAGGHARAQGMGACAVPGPDGRRAGRHAGDRRAARQAGMQATGWLAGKSDRHSMRSTLRQLPAAVVLTCAPHRPLHVQQVEQNQQRAARNVQLAAAATVQAERCQGSAQHTGRVAGSLERQLRSDAGMPGERLTGRGCMCAGGRRAWMDGCKPANSQQRAGRPDQPGGGDQARPRMYHACVRMLTGEPPSQPLECVEY